MDNVLFQRCLAVAQTIIVVTLIVLILQWLLNIVKINLRTTGVEPSAEEDSLSDSDGDEFERARAAVIARFLERI